MQNHQQEEIWQRFNDPLSSEIPQIRASRVLPAPFTSFSLNIDQDLTKRQLSRCQRNVQFRRFLLINVDFQKFDWDSIWIGVTSEMFKTCMGLVTLMVRFGSRIRLVVIRLSIFRYRQHAETVNNHNDMVDVIVLFNKVVTAQFY